MAPSLSNASPASPWKRLVAFLIDLPLLLVLGWGARQLLPQVVGIEYLVCWAYFAALESSRLQATPGKQALGLKIADLQGNRVGFWRASSRYWVKLISLISLGAGFAMAFVTDKKQAFHDYVAGCLVLDPRAPLAASPATTEAGTADS